ncbi:hypothetical protein L3X38_031504 [Prunus dulcis]|uniref:Uncharacterized protein n=1 Tax=Prunus dulcis TaxID=3755 RepID=A0AAD4YU37_PRUDU|nr:hypothetical protein L3X38_031504 [Prunus dulcis]
MLQLHASTIATTHLQTERHRFRWNHNTSFFPFQPTATSIHSCRRRKQPRNEAVLTFFQQTFGLSFSLISPPNLTSKVLRPRICNMHDPLRVRQCGTTCTLHSGLIWRFTENLAYR